MAISVNIYYSGTDSNAKIKKCLPLCRRITATVRKEERGHGEAHDREEKGYYELPLFAYSIWQLRSSKLLIKYTKSNLV